MSLSKALLALTAAAALSSTAALANKVTFSEGEREGNFFCTVNTSVPFKTVDIHTDGLEVSGFCKGQEYVENAGHLSGFPMSDLKTVFFKYKKNLGKVGSVEIVAANDDDVTCSEGVGEGRTQYGNGEYC